MAVSIKELKRKSSQLKAKLKEVGDEIDEKLMKDEEVSDLEAEFEDLKSKLSKLEDNIKRKEEEDSEQAEEPEDEAEKAFNAPAIVKGQVGSGHDPKYGVGRVAILKAMRHYGSPREVQKNFSNSFGVKEYEALTKDLSSTAQPLVPQYYDGFIELVRAKCIMLEIANTIQLQNGNVTIPRAIAGSTAAYVGEGAIIPSSAPNFDTVNMIWKKMAVTTSLTKELAMFGAIDVSRIVTEDLSRQLAIGIDAALLNNTAASTYSPNGLMGYTTSSGNVLTTSATTFQGITSALYEALSFVRGHNFGSDLVWIMPVQTELYLRSVTTDLGIFPFAQYMDQNDGKLFGAKVYSTNLLPTDTASTATTPTDTVGSIFLADPRYLQLGIASDIDVTVTDVGSLSNSSGVVTENAFSQDLTLIKATHRHDFAVTLDNAVYRIDANGWSLSPSASVPYNTQTQNDNGSSASGAKGKSAS